MSRSKISLLCSVPLAVVTSTQEGFRANLERNNQNRSNHSAGVENSRLVVVNFVANFGSLFLKRGFKILSHRYVGQVAPVIGVGGLFGRMSAGPPGTIWRDQVVSTYE